MTLYNSLPLEVLLLSHVRPVLAVCDTGERTYYMSPVGLSGRYLLGGHRCRVCVVLSFFPKSFSVRKVGNRGYTVISLTLKQAG